MTPTFLEIVDSFADLRDERPFESDEWIERERRKLWVDAPTINEPQGFKATLTAFLNCVAFNDEHGPILDFGGGSGYLYFMLRHYLYKRETAWHVVDKPGLAELGLAFAKENGPSNIQFFANLEATRNNVYRIVHSSTTLQYIDDAFGLLDELLALRPKYFLLTRAKISFNQTFIVAQKVVGKLTPCRFMKLEELRDFVCAKDYELLFQNRAEEDIASQIAATVGDHYRNVASMNFFFARRSGR
ncbi:MAG: hypothetical protein CFH10_00813 [Alphaproteobacteria bacterium MarineAlpha4_Bin2]|nr:MAG: hypothetical protein CFH10_00813 [Alphaproteobacteria bacterium MarineAlpha4_Bin2]